MGRFDARLERLRSCDATVKHESPPRDNPAEAFDPPGEALLFSEIMPPPAGPDFGTIDPTEAEGLIREGAIRVLDVRTPQEYASLGHIPEAILLPVDLIACGAATLPRDGKPLLVYCEHGIRSRSAAGFLARAGMEGIFNLEGGLALWRGPRGFSPG